VRYLGSISNRRLMDPSSRGVVPLAHCGASSAATLPTIHFDSAIHFGSHANGGAKWQSRHHRPKAVPSMADKFVTAGRYQLVIFLSETAGTIGILPMTTCPAGYGVLLTRDATQTR
jgi:hypothetical protein